MTFTQNKMAHLKKLSILIGLLLFSRILFVCLMPATYSTDLNSWLRVIEMLDKGENPYNSGVLNWPPVWMQFLFAVGRLSEITTIPKIYLIQSLLVIAECAGLVLTYCILLKLEVKEKLSIVLMTGLALNPICIFLSCQHCNFDVFIGVWILLFVYLMLGYFKEKEPYYWLAASFCLGMGILTKTIPFVLSPILLVGVLNRKAGITFFGLMLLFMPVTIGMSIIYTLCPNGVSQNVLSYRSMAGWYGITGLMNLKDMDNLIEAYRSISPFLILALMAWTSVSVYRKETITCKQLIVLALTILVFLPTFGPGYTPPYILWYLPLGVIYYFLAGADGKHLMMAGLLILCLTYTFEYAMFNSHGSFIKFFTHSERVAVFSEKVGHSAYQTMIRLPMFLFYLTFFVSLLRDKNNILTHKRQWKP